MRKDGQRRQRERKKLLLPNNTYPSNFIGSIEVRGNPGQSGGNNGLIQSGEENSKHQA